MVNNSRPNSSFLDIPTIKEDVFQLETRRMNLLQGGDLQRPAGLLKDRLVCGGPWMGRTTSIFKIAYYSYK